MQSAEVEEGIRDTGKNTDAETMGCHYSGRGIRRIGLCQTLGTIVGAGGFQTRASGERGKLLRLSTLPAGSDRSQY